jgi:hypothetical protein
MTSAGQLQACCRGNAGLADSAFARIKKEAHNAGSAGCAHGFKLRLPLQLLAHNFRCRLARVRTLRGGSV